MEAAIWTANSEQCESRPYLEEIRRQILEQITDIPSLPSPLSLNSTDIALSGDGTVGGEGSNVVQASEMVVNDWEEREGEEEKQENISPKLKNVKQEKEGRNDDFFYFYQSDDGQQAFLHPVCSRILQTGFYFYFPFSLSFNSFFFFCLFFLHCFSDKKIVDLRIWEFVEMSLRTERSENFGNRSLASK